MLGCSTAASIGVSTPRFRILVFKKGRDSLSFWLAFRRPLLKRDRNDSRSPRPARLARLAARLGRFAPCGACVAVLRPPALALRFRQEAAQPCPSPGRAAALAGRTRSRPFDFISGARWPTAASRTRAAVSPANARGMTDRAKRGRESVGEVCGCGAVLGGIEGRSRLALAWSSERPLSDRREDMPLSDRQPAEGFAGGGVDDIATLNL
jgi:hypothetical protein